MIVKDPDQKKIFENGTLYPNALRIPKGFGLGPLTAEIWAFLPICAFAHPTEKPPLKIQILFPTFDDQFSHLILKYLPKSPPLMRLASSFPLVPCILMRWLTTHKGLVINTFIAPVIFTKKIINHAKICQINCKHFYLHSKQKRDPWEPSLYLVSDDFSDRETCRNRWN